jgi:PAS domain S-box-containing protein
MHMASEWLSTRPKPLVVALGLTGVFLLDLVDYVSHADIRFSLFYLLVVTAVGWFGGRGAGITMAIATGVSRLVIDALLHRVGPYAWVPVFNLVAQTGMLAIVAALASSSRQLLAASDERIAQRTAELQKEISDRKQIEEKLRTSEERFRQLAENINEVFWMTNVDKSQMIYISPAYETIWGRSPESLYQSPRSWMDVIAPEDRERVAAAAMKQTEGHYDERYRIVRPDGSYRWIRDRAFPIHDSAGVIYRVAGIAEDITEQMEAEERFRRFIDLKAFIAFIKDESGRYVYANSSLERRCRGSIVGKTCPELFPTAVAARLGENDQAVLAAGTTLEFTDSVTFPDGTTSDWHNFKFPFRDTAGRRFIGCIGMEVTQLRNLEKQIIEISDREQARIGHDLHDGLCQFLVSTAFDCNHLQERLAAAHRPEVADMEKISSLLDTAITQARRLARGLYPVQLEADGLGSALEELADSARARFKIDCVAECVPPVFVPDNTVATHLYRIAQEALNNAVRHGQPSRIDIRLQMANHRLELTIRDDGVGLAPDGKSEGLGMHIMDYRTRTIGGGLEIRGEPGGGTTVRCSVPLDTMQPI